MIEPAGMTYQEMDRTSELLNPLAGKLCGRMNTIWICPFDYSRDRASSRYCWAGKAPWIMRRLILSVKQVYLENRMLEVKSINQYYGESHTLWDLYMHIPEGKCTVLMGRNGVGNHVAAMHHGAG